LLIVKRNVSYQMIKSQPHVTKRIVIKLREAMLAYKRRTGERMTYALLAERTGIAQGTLRNIGSQPTYNATIATLTSICIALDVTPGDLLELIDDPPKAKRRARRKKGGR
jgi:DNA-binding Xre family transcriptional regulator